MIGQSGCLFTRASRKLWAAVSSDTKVHPPALLSHKPPRLFTILYKPLSFVSYSHEIATNCPLASYVTLICSGLSLLTRSLASILITDLIIYQIPPWLLTNKHICMHTTLNLWRWLAWSCPPTTCPIRFVLEDVGMAEGPVGDEKKMVMHHPQLPQAIDHVPDFASQPTALSSRSWLPRG